MEMRGKKVKELKRRANLTHELTDTVWDINQNVAKPDKFRQLKKAYHAVHNEKTT